MPRGLIHTLTIKHPALNTRDAEGRTTPTYTTTTTRGRVGTPSEDEFVLFAQTGEEIHAMAVIPKSASFSREDHIVVANTGPLNLDGEYEIRGDHPLGTPNVGGHHRVKLARFVT